VHLLDGEIALLPLGVRVLSRLDDMFRGACPPIQEVRLPGGQFHLNWQRLVQEQTQSYRQLPIAFMVRDYERRSGPLQGLAQPQTRSGWHWFYLDESRKAVQEMGDLWTENIQTIFTSIRLTPQRFEYAPDGFGWVSLQEEGPDRFLACSDCSYFALTKTARFSRQVGHEQVMQESRLISTPGANTIRDLADTLAIPESGILKSLFLIGENAELLLIILRADLEISTEKISRITGYRSFRPATESEIQSVGAVPGYASPVGLHVRGMEQDHGLFVIADPSIETASNFVMGANQPDHHLQGANYPRDFEVTMIVDIAAAKAGYPCPECSKPLKDLRGIHLGGWQTYPDSIRYTTARGIEELGQVGIGNLVLESIVAALLAEHRDDDGMVWPPSVAPFDVHIIDLNSFEPATALAQSLEKVGVQVLHDDREVSPGVKFFDADLIGCPIRLTVSKRNLEKGGVEMVIRGEEGKRFLAMEDVVTRVQSTLSSIM
jgi:prolyl-tRNA synthetase